MARWDSMDWSLSQIEASGLSGDTSLRELQQISELVTELEENIFQEMHPGAKPGFIELAQKLDLDDPMTAEDHARLRCWVMAESQAFERMELECQLDIEAFNRAVSEIAELAEQDRTVETIGQLAGVVRDARRRLARIRFQKRDQLRIQALEKASADLSPRSKKTLARLLRASMGS